MLHYLCRGFILAGKADQVLSGCLLAKKADYCKFVIEWVWLCHESVHSGLGSVIESRFLNIYALKAWRCRYCKIQVLKELPWIIYKQRLGKSKQTARYFSVNSWKNTWLFDFSKEAIYCRIICQKTHYYECSGIFIPIWSYYSECLIKFILAAVFLQLLQYTKGHVAMWQ